MNDKDLMFIAILVGAAILVAVMAWLGQRRRRKKEALRIATIAQAAKEFGWGTGVRQALINEGINLVSDKRALTILNLHETFGDDICERLLRRKIALGMTEMMVTLSWGEPSLKETKSISAKKVKTRWTYGVPRTEGVQYVWFTDSVVSKIGN